MTRTARTLSAVLAATCATGAGVALAASAGASGTHAHAHDHTERSGAQLAATRAATAQYHRVDAAVDDGYRPSAVCAESPDGAMGFHYVNPSRMGSTDPRKPTALLYAPTPSGGLRLVGVEWIAVDADQDLGTDDDRPTMFGRPFDGPMAGHEPGMPVHYDLHAWVWSHNPDGTFAPWNPALSC